MLISKLYLSIRSFYKFSASLYEGNLDALKINSPLSGVGRSKYRVITVVKSPFIYSKAKEQFTQTYNFSFLVYFKISRLISSWVLSKNVLFVLLKSTKSYNRYYTYDIRRFW